MTSPRFTTVIPTSEPSGNIMSIMGCARSLLRSLGVEPAKIDDMSSRVMEAESYDAACDIVREWFPLEHDATGAA